MLPYKIMMECRNGTRTLSSSTNYTVWKDNYSVITWCYEETLEDALKTKDSLYNPKEIKSIWIEKL